MISVINIETILVAVVFAVFIILSVIGYMKGAIKILVSFVSLFISIILVFIIYPTATTMLNDTQVKKIVEDKVSDYVDDNLNLNKLNEIEQTGVEAQQNILDEMPLPKGIIEKLKENNNENTYKSLEVTNFKDYVKAYITTEMVRILSFALVFIVVHLLVMIFVALTQIATKLPGVEFADRTLGVIIGLAEAYILVLVFCIIITALSGVSGMKPIFDAIHNNKILNAIYENNILLTLLLKFL